MSTYTRVQVSSVSQEVEEVLADLAFEFGATGISENLKFTQPDLTYDPIVIHQQGRPLDIFFDRTPEEQFFRRLKSLDEKAEFQVYQEESKDWLEDWKKGYTSFELVPGTWVVPSWETPQAGSSHVIHIDPGMAFGTGTHATTQSAARLILKSLNALGESVPRSVLDVGTGTGILAMLAAQNGAAPVVGIEIDAIARDVAKENVALNGLEKIQIPDLDLSELQEQFDLVVANIIDGVLIQIKSDLLRCLKAQGELVLSGILLEREARFQQGFLTSDVEVIERITQDEWVALRVRKRAAAHFPAGVIEH